MCGIFGIIVKPQSNITAKNIAKTLKRIALLSESRGKDSSGIAFRNLESKQISIIKGDIPISHLLRSREYNVSLSQNISSYNRDNNFFAFGHARLVTNGSQLIQVNNQPVIKDEMVVVHNGIIVNVEELWASHSNLHRKYLIDTEIIPSLISDKLEKNCNIPEAVSSALSLLKGTFSLGIMFNNYDYFILATNNGSLYYMTDNENYLVFASEKYILEQLKCDNPYKTFTNTVEIVQLSPDNGLIVKCSTFAKQHLDLKVVNPIFNFGSENTHFSVEKNELTNSNKKKEFVIDPSSFINSDKESPLYNLLEDNIDFARNLRRCTRCILPETFPFIEFDSEGVCNYCHNHKTSRAVKSLDELDNIVKPYRKAKGRPDCIVPFSGGRDSTYSLHIIKKNLGLNPIAFTYDWGMVTDLGRRNIARVCGKLGVENIIVSADIRRKRENIRKNIEAWLKNPALGMIPLFMAGDKFFFYYCNQVKKQTGIDLNIWGINNLENTNFKTGFAGLKPNFDKETIYSLSRQDQIKLFKFVGTNMLKSPGYFNSSMIDSLGSFIVRYISPKKDYYHLFDYYQWDEKEVNTLLTKEYDWELASDTNTTWRIGDGTASFYNYIYHTVAGFSEYDTFRSNQIREGMLDRETALKLVEDENRPRFESLRWYLEIIGLDFEKVIKAINSIPKIYSNSFSKYE